MINSITVKKIIPSIVIYSVLLLLTIAVDYLLHLLSLVFIGRYFGIIGSSIILISFLYSLRKRKIIKSGSPKTFLKSHEVLGWIGALLVCIHGGVHFNAVIPWAALFSMLIVVASGLVGKHLLNTLKEELLNKKKELINNNFSVDEIEKEVIFDSLLIEKMQKWRKIHLPITSIFFVLALIHIISILLLW